MEIHRGFWYKIGLFLLAYMKPQYSFIVKGEFPYNRETHLFTFKLCKCGCNSWVLIIHCEYTLDFS